MATIPVPPPLPLATGAASFKPMSKPADERISNNTEPADNAQLLDPEAEAEKLWRCRRVCQSSVYCIAPVPPVLQSGPTCGLVALAMAIAALGIRSHVHDILSEARSLQLTLQGEMMSVRSMKVLCEKMFPVTASLVLGIRSNVTRVIDHLSRGLPVLLPYDCDANHEPAVRNGKRAHWAVLLGFLLTLDVDADSEPRLVRWPTPVSPKQLLTAQSSAHSPIDPLFVFARQGKSRYMQLWNFNELCESSENLLQMNDKLSGETHVVPDGGDLTESLADQLLLIQPMGADTRESN